MLSAAETVLTADRVNTLCEEREGGEMELWTGDIDEIPREMRKTLEEDYDLSYHHLE